jgi:hypothetical protein
MVNDMATMVQKIRYRLDDLDISNEEFGDKYLENHIQNNMDIYDWSFPIERGRDVQLVIIEAMIDIIMAIKIWADGESYSYKNDAIQVTRGLMSKHFQDTINLLKEERNEIIGMDGGFA